MVLLVDDQAIVAEAVRRSLEDQDDITVHHCQEPSQSVSRAAQLQPTVILLDLVMPDIDGFTVLRFLQAHPELRKIPVVVLSSKEAPEEKARAFQLGANDYLVKPPHSTELLARVRYHSQAYRHRIERDQAFSALRESQAELEASYQRLQTLHLKLAEASEAKGRFLATMSHEIRTPMNAILGMTDLLKSTRPTAQQSEYIDTVRFSARALLDLLNDVLDVCKMEAGKLNLEHTDFDLEEVVEGTTRLLAGPAQAKGVDVQAILARDVPRAVRGDPNRLRQILLNLISNAVKFTEEGHVAIRVTREAPDSQVIRFAVRDTGIGISDEARLKIFEEFAQAEASTTRQYGGTGLGLAICKHLGRLMGGDIEMESEFGVGSEFAFWLPLEFREQAPEPEPEDLKALVLVMNPLLREFLSEHLHAAQLVFASEESDPQEAAFDAILVEGGERAESLAAQGGESYPPVLSLVPLTYERPEPSKVSGYLTRPVRRRELFRLLRGEGHPSMEEAPVASTGIRVLVAEDNPINQAIAEVTLGNLGYEVDLVSDGLQALEKARENTYGVILLDCEMPVMDGFEAAAAIRGCLAGQPRTPILAMTGHSGDAERDRCLKAGMDDFLTKPVESDQLKAVLGRWTTVSQ